jgi:hypothetical protein
VLKLALFIFGVTGYRKSAARELVGACITDFGRGRTRRALS